MESGYKSTIALTIGDPAGIGPEIVLKAFKQADLHVWCKPVVIGDARVLEYYAKLMQLPIRLRCVAGPEEARHEAGTIDVVHRENVDMSRFQPGAIEAVYGHAMLDYTEHAIRLAVEGRVDAVLGGPHTKKAVELAGIEFDGYPGYVAKVTGTDPEDTFLMLGCDRMRIVNATLHISLREALDRIDRKLVAKAIRATDQAMRKMGVAKPRIAVAGINPHAGEQGMFGNEENVHIEPAVAEARAEGIDVSGPFGADTMLLETGKGTYDAYIAMYHDQGHIPVKLVAFPNVTAVTIGAPVLFASVGHGSAPDIAGKGIADPGGVMGALKFLANRK